MKMNRGGFGGGMGNMQNLMKQAKKMQADMQKAQEELEKEIVTVETAGGMIKIEITGKRMLKSIKIDPQAVDPDDVDMLEDLILAGVNEAIKKVNDLTDSKMGGATGSIPGGMF